MGLPAGSMVVSSPHAFNCFFSFLVCKSGNTEERKDQVLNVPRKGAVLASATVSGRLTVAGAFVFLQVSQ